MTKRIIALLLLLITATAFAEDKQGGVVIYTPAGGGTTNPPASSGQILGAFGIVPEWENVVGDGTFTRTGNNTYNLTVTHLSGVTGPFAPTNSPTFTGTVTMPDGSTFGATGATGLTLTAPLTVSSGGTGNASVPAVGQVLVGQANGTYAPSLTLSGLTITNTTLIGTTINGSTLNSPTLNNATITGSTIRGVTDGSDAAPGTVGEFVTQNGTTTIPANVPGTSTYTVLYTMNLTPGDWDVYVNFYVLISYGGGNVVGALAWWGVLLPSSIPLADTDSTPVSSTVAWIGGQYTDAPLAEGGTIGPVRFSSATAGGMDARIGVAGTSGNALVDWVVSARRMR